MRSTGQFGALCGVQVRRKYSAGLGVSAQKKEAGAGGGTHLNSFKKARVGELSLSLVQHTWSVLSRSCLSSFFWMGVIWAYSRISFLEGRLVSTSVLMRRSRKGLEEGARVGKVGAE
jgi:hypothetical protein